MCDCLFDLRARTGDQTANENSRKLARCGRRVRSTRWMSDCDQQARGSGPKPESTLMWPASPRLMSCAPQRAAHGAALSAGIHGSVSLARARWARPRRRAAARRPGRNSAGSAGATNSARRCPAARAAAAARVRQRQAAEAVGHGNPRPARIARERLADALATSAQVGHGPVVLLNAHRVAEVRLSQVCQWVGPLPCRPGHEQHAPALWPLIAIGLTASRSTLRST